MTTHDPVGLPVPMADLYAQYLSLKPDIDAAIERVIQTSAFIRGPEVEAFETAFATAVSVDYCVSCANGTDALYIAMVALGLRPGDEVIVPAMTWVSTSETVSQAGGRPVFCDIEPASRTLNPEKLVSMIGPRTVGIIPVHLYGHPARMDRIMAIAKQFGLWVIEDCAQAHLAEFGGRQVGSFGAAAGFSFYPGKNLGAIGDAGAVVTGDPWLARQMGMFARHGGIRKGDHEIEGINSRLDGLQAAVLNVKLPHLARWTARRQAIAAAYTDGLSGLSWLQLPTVADDASHVWHLYVVESDERDGLVAHLNAAGIQTSVNYPRALHQLPCYAHMGHTPEDFPVAQRLADRGLALPMFPEMSNVQVVKVIAAVRSFHAT